MPDPAPPATSAAADLLAHRPWVRSLARSLVRGDDAVDDVEQETWVTALRKAPDEPRALRAWLGVVARRVALQRLRGDRRRAARQAAVARPLDAAVAQDVVAEADAHAHVVAAVLALAEPYRTTVLLRWFEGLDVAAVAARMDVPVDTVRTRLRRAHGMLRQKLEREHRDAVALLAALPAGVTAPATVGIGGAVAGTLVVAAAVVGLLWGGAWLLSEAPGAARPLVAAAGPAAPPQPAPPAQQAPPLPPPAAARIEVRDLADASLVRGIDIELTMRDGTTNTLRSDRLDVDPASVVRAKLAGGPSEWRLAAPEIHLDEKTLWVWQESAVAIHVSASASAASTGTGVHGFGAADSPSPPPAPAELQIAWTVRAPAGAAPGPGSRAGSSWLRKHGVVLPEKQRVPRPASGPVVVRAPRIAGLCVIVGAEGWTPAELDVATPAAALPADLQTQITSPKPLRAVLVKSPVFAGRIRDRAGRPRPGVSVMLNVLREVDDAGVWPAVAHATSGGATWRARPGGRADICRWTSATTGADGAFSLCTDAIGRHELVILAPDVIPVRLAIDAASGEVHGGVKGLGDLVAEVSVSSVAVSRAAAHKGQLATFQAHSAEPPFPKVTLRGLAEPGDRFEIAGTTASGVRWSGVVADDGTVPGAWFEQAQSYRIDVRRADGTFVTTRFFRWEPAPSLDLAAFPERDPDAPR